MIAEYHREKKAWPVVLLFVAIIVACFTVPPPARGAFSSRGNAPVPKKGGLPTLPFATERPTEPVLGESSER